MKYQEYRRLTIIGTVVLALLVASVPFLQQVLVYPQTDFFTEVWLLGAGHMAEAYPFNVTAGISYDVFLGLANHLGHSSYYQVQVKLRNQTQSGPDSFDLTSSSLPSLQNVYSFVVDNGTWEFPVSFSFNYVIDVARSQIELDSMVFNGNSLGLSGCVVSLDPQKQQYLVNLFFEVWIYDVASGAFKYHERFVGLWFNLEE